MRPPPWIRIHAARADRSTVVVRVAVPIILRVGPEEYEIGEIGQDTGMPGLIALLRAAADEMERRTA